MADRMRRSVQQPLPPMELQHLDLHDHRPAKQDDGPLQNVDLTLDQARALVGQVFTETLTLTGTALKDYGDPSQVGKWKTGDNPNLLRIAQRTAVRRRFALQLLATCPGVKFDLHVFVDGEKVSA